MKRKEKEFVLLCLCESELVIVKRES